MHLFLEELVLAMHCCTVASTDFEENTTASGRIELGSSLDRRSYEIYPCYTADDEATQLFGLTISLGKTEVLYQPAPGTTAPPPKAGTELEAVDHFRYMGSIIFSDASLHKEIAGRISKASKSLGRLPSRVTNYSNGKLCTTLKVYKTVVLTTLLYSGET